MARSIRPDELEKIRKAVTGDAENAAREAAGKALRKAIPFEPAPTDGAPDPDAPHHAIIHFPQTRARLTSDPKKGPGGDVDLNVIKPDGTPVDVPEITAGGGTKGGKVTLDPRAVPEALEQLGGAEINKDKTVQFSQMVDGTQTGRVKG
jgi:hypothetical protein